MCVLITVRTHIAAITTCAVIEFTCRMPRADRTRMQQGHNLRSSFRTSPRAHSNSWHMTLYEHQMSGLSFANFCDFVANWNTDIIRIWISGQGNGLITELIVVHEKKIRKFFSLSILAARQGMLWGFVTSLNSQAAFTTTQQILCKSPSSTLWRYRTDRLAKKC